MPPATRDSLLALRVARVLELHEAALDVLVEHGFTPLAQTHLRALLAPTVTLAQAIRLRSLPPEREESLLDALEGLMAGPAALVARHRTRPAGATAPDARPASASEDPSVAADQRREAATCR